MDEDNSTDIETSGVESRFRSISFGHLLDYGEWISVADFCYYYGLIQWVFDTTPEIPMEVWIVDEDNYESFKAGEYAVGYCVSINDEGYGAARPESSDTWHVVIWNRYFSGLIYVEGEVGFEIIYSVDVETTDPESVEGSENLTPIFIVLCLLSVLLLVGALVFIKLRLDHSHVPLVKGSTRNPKSKKGEYIIGEINSGSSRGIPREFYKIVHEKPTNSGRIKRHEMADLRIPKRTRYASYFYKGNILHIRFKGKASS